MMFVDLLVYYTSASYLQPNRVMFSSSRRLHREYLGERMATSGGDDLMTPRLSFSTALWT